MAFLCVMFYVYSIKQKEKGERGRANNGLNIGSFLVADTAVIVVDHGAHDSCGSLNLPISSPKVICCFICVSLQLERCH